MPTSTSTSAPPRPPQSVNWGRSLKLLLTLVLMVGLLIPAITSTAQAKRGEPRAHPALLQLAAEHPDEPFRVIIQREVKASALPDDSPETAVAQEGGQVRKRLRMIKSFSAELTGKAITKLARHKQVRWITFDAPLVSTAAGDPTVRDEFTTAVYSNNNGTQPWAGSWVETGDDGKPGTGDVRISSGQLQLKNKNGTLSRPVNLAGAVAATLSFQYKRSGLDDANDYVALQASANGGGSWTELARYAGAATDSAWQTASLSLLSYAAASTQIRFATSSSLGSSDILYVDNVQIEYVLSAPTPTATPAPTATLPPPGSFVVNSTGDVADANTADGVCQTSTAGQRTLRAAIQQANTSAGVNTITFNIAGAGPHTITPNPALPTITDPVTIDATTDDSFAANANRPAITLAGSNAGFWDPGLVLGPTADGSIIRGLVIRDWGGDGIDIQPGSDNNVIAGNYIGRLTAAGVDSGAGTQNGYEGIWVQGAGNRIGGASAADANVISGNGSYGVRIEGSGATGNQVLGNYLGTDATGTVKLGNTYAGVGIGDAANNTVGGATAGARNLISGNNEAGVELWGATSTGNKVVGNWIGLDATGAASLGNTWAGVWLNSGAAGNIIGGTVSGAGNVIAGNGGDGVELRYDAGAGNAILGNGIYTNAESGIDLIDDGTSSNNGAVGSGPNSGMDYPVITGASLSGCQLAVAGYVGSAANQSIFANARVEFFKAAPDSSGYGEGQTFLGALTTDANGAFSRALLATGFNATDRLTATATNSGNNTSEFGPNYQVTTATGNCTPNPFASAVRAPELWQQSPPLQGQGITVAVVDSGIAAHPDLQGHILASTNQTADADADDHYVHGTHVAGIIVADGASSNGARSGVAPRVNLVNVKVSNDQGLGTTADLVDGLQWILEHKDTYNIRVVNISLISAVPESYHTSPIDAAVEILWFNGIVVVVAAGNNGTGTGSVPLYPPANDPFVLTVGAADDQGTPALSDDALAPFSAYGTTEDGFAKPDLVAPGRNLISLLASTSASGYVNHPAHRIDHAHFRMSGTSMSAPVLSGAVALLLQDEPSLTPDQVKYRLKATASTAWPGYDAARAGAGYLDAYAAVHGTTTASANTGLAVSQLLTTGSDPVNSVANWGSVNWGSVNWGSVNWGSVNWGSAVWDD